MSFEMERAIQYVAENRSYLQDLRFKGINFRRENRTPKIDLSFLDEIGLGFIPIIVTDALCEGSEILDQALDILLPKPKDFTTYFVKESPIEQKMHKWDERKYQAMLDDHYKPSRMLAEEQEARKLEKLSPWL